MRTLSRAKGSGSLPGRHTFSGVGLARIFPSDDPLRRRWAVVGAVLATAAALWSVVWVEHSTARDPQPLLWRAPAPAAVISMPPPSSAPALVAARSSSLVTIAPSLVPARSSPTVTVTPSRTPTHARPTSVPGVPVPEKVVLKATYAVGASWDTGFTCGVTVTNVSKTPRSWTVTVRYDGSAGVRVTQVWDATLTRQGNTNIFRGGPLAPGATQSFGFEATKRTNGPVRPAAFTVN